MGQNSEKAALELAAAAFGLLNRLFGNRVRLRHCSLRSNCGVSGSLIVALDLEILLGYLDKLLACPGSQTFPALRHTQTGFSSR